MGAVHHIELWIPDPRSAGPRWQWLLAEPGDESHEVELVADGPLSVQGLAAG